MKKILLAFLLLFSFALTGCGIPDLGNGSGIDAEVEEVLKEYTPSCKKIEDETNKYEKSSLIQAGILNVYVLKDSQNEEVSNGYLVNANGRNGVIKMVLVLSNTDNVVLGLKVMEHTETESFGKILLESPDFESQFINLPFDNVDTNVKYDGIASASLTLNGVKDSVKKVITFHKTKNQSGTTNNANVSSEERALMGLDKNDELVDKSEEFLNTLKANVSENMYNTLTKNLGLKYYVEILDGNKNIKGYGYIVEGKYNYEAENGSRLTCSYKLSLTMDKNYSNIKVTVLSSEDTIKDTFVEETAVTDWINNNYNGKSIKEISEMGTNVDSIVGATFTSSAYRNHISYIVKAHLRVFPEQ